MPIFIFFQEFGLSNNLKKHRQLERAKSCRREAHDWRRHVKALCRDNAVWSELVAKLKADMASSLEHVSRDWRLLSDLMS